MSLFTRDKVYLSADRQSYFQYDNGTMTMVVDGTTVISATSNGLDIEIAFDTAADFVPEVDNSYDLGSTSLAWAEVYGVAFDAGRSGVAGTVDVFPSTASRGKFIIDCIDQDGDTNVTLRPAAMGQASVISLPDPGAATANVVLTDAANDGVVVNATAAEINQYCDESANTEVVTTTNVITAAESGKTFILNSATAFVSTLPVVAAGLRFTFIAGATQVTGGNHTIVPNAANDDTIYGEYLVAGATVPASAEGSINWIADTILPGDRVDLFCDGTNWYVSGMAAAAGAITFTT